MKALSWGKLLGAARTHSRRFAQCFQAILLVLSTRIGIDTMKSNSNRDHRSRRNRFAAGLSNLFHMQGQTPRAPAGPVRPIEVAAGQQVSIPPIPYHTGGIVNDNNANREYLNSLLERRSGSFFVNREGLPIQFLGEGQFGFDPGSGDFSATGRVSFDRDDITQRQSSGAYITASDLRVSNISVNNGNSGLVRFSHAAEINRMTLQQELDRAQFRARNLVIRDSRGNVVFSGEGPVTVSERKETITHPDAGKVLTRPMRTVFGRAVEEVRNKDGTVSIRPRRATGK